MKKVLTIAGSDSGGGAGIQADLKTFAACGVYGMSAITALTAQNTVGIRMVENVSEEMVRAQIKAVLEDIGADAIKIGMLSSAGIISAVVDAIKDFKVSNIVWDPVMVSTSGHRLIEEEAFALLMEKLLPLADLITPNIDEAEAILDHLEYNKNQQGFSKKIQIQNEEEMETAALHLTGYTGNYVLIKGGHLMGEMTDVLAKESSLWKYEGQKIHTKNTHGTGCTLSSAIAAYLALGFTMQEAIGKSKKLITGAIEHSLDIGKGDGPTNPMYHLYELYEKERN